MSAYLEGYESFFNGIDLKSNPYSPENDYSKWDEWSLGWIDAKGIYW